jgi:hypothetical protein
MTTALTVNGVDLASLGVVVSSVSGLDAWPTRTGTYTQVPGWDGTRLASATRSPQDRTIRVTGLVDGRGGTLYTRLAALADLLEHGLLELRVPSRRPGLVWYGVLEGTRGVQSPAPDLLQPWVNVDWSFRCPDPFGYAESPTLVTAPAATRRACPIGSARSLPTVLIVGPYTNPVLIHRDGQGYELGRVTITDTAADATTHLRLITDTGGEIRRLTTSTDVRDDDAAAPGWRVPELRPEYAIPGGAQTLEVSSGTLQVHYTRCER